jgi:hypothetical protein
MVNTEITIPTGDAPSGDGILDMITNFALNNSKLLAVIIVIGALMGVATLAGDFVGGIVGKFKIFIGIAVIAAIVVGGVAFFK